MNVSVYLSAREGKNPDFRILAQQLGNYLAEKHHTLVYGASDMGLMKVLAEATIDHGGAVIGVTSPEFERFVNPEGQDTLFCQTIAARRKKMYDLGEFYIALPGGVGTLDEISEVICYTMLAKEPKKVCLLNYEGYYDALQGQIYQMVQEKMVDPSIMNLVLFPKDLDELTALMEE